MAETAHRIKPGASVDEAFAALDADPTRLLSGTDALQKWMQAKSDEAIAALADVHFDIPEPIRRLECRIAPSHDGVIYYTGPSEDLVTRPGRMWWSVPAGVTEFGTWRELTTVYHEGVPGHHLQVAQTAYRRETLNRWRRLASWSSGHGEGWALYSERLMADLGFLDDPADFLGMLDAQSMRAARVVLDIGIHCGFPAPSEVGGGDWTYDKAWQLPGRPRQPGRRLPALRARPLPGLAGAGAVVQGRRAVLAAAARRGPGQGRRRVRPEGVPPARARHRLGRAGRAAGRRPRRVLTARPARRHSRTNENVF